MPLPDDLKDDLRAALRYLRASNPITTLPDAPGKALEAWLLMRLAMTTRRWATWESTLRNGDGSPVPPFGVFRFPAGQSGIRASNPTGPGFVLLTHFTICDRRFELHGGLQWEGRSGATHECDVSVIPAAIAEALRLNGGGTPRGLPIAAFECKDRDTKGGVDEMRQTVARLYDLALITSPAIGPCRIWEPKTPSRWGRRRSTYRSFFKHGAFGIVRTGDFSDGASKLGRHYEVQQYRHVYSDPATIENIECAFRKMLASVATF